MALSYDTYRLCAEEEYFHLHQALLAEEDKIDQGLAEPNNLAYMHARREFEEFTTSALDVQSEPDGTVSDATIQKLFQDAQQKPGTYHKYVNAAGETVNGLPVGHNFRTFMSRYMHVLCASDTTEGKRAA